MNDIIGREVAVGDQVAHIRKESGNKFGARIGRVLQARPSEDFFARQGDFEIQLQWLLDGHNARVGQRSGWIATHNVLLIEKVAE